MFERFTRRSIEAITLANEEAALLNRGTVGSEHVLLGVARVPFGVAGYVLARLGVQPEAIRTELEKRKSPLSEGTAVETLSLTPSARHLLEAAMEETQDLDHGYVGTEHLILAVTRAPDDVAASQVLAGLGLNLFEIREEVLSILGHGSQGTNDFSTEP